MTSPARGERVSRAHEVWIRRLIDLSRRNNLPYYRELKTGTLDLDGHDPEALVALVRAIRSRCRDCSPHPSRKIDVLGFSRRVPTIESALRDAIARTATA